MPGEKFEEDLGALLTDKVSGGDGYSKCNAARVYTPDAAPASAPEPDSGIS